MAVRVNQRIRMRQQLVTLIAIGKEVEAPGAVRKAKQAIFRTIEDIQHGILEGIAEHDFIVVVIATGDHFTIPLNLKRPAFRTAAGILVADFSAPLTLTVITTVAKIVRTPNFDRLNLGLPELSESAFIFGILRHGQVRELDLGMQAQFFAQCEKIKQAVASLLVVQSLHHDVIGVAAHPVKTDTHLVQASLEYASGTFTA